jgi:SAM-dependent methyltransferase
MSLSANDWHIRYTQQARWTYNLRQYVYSRAGLNTARRVLEVGCGTGALLAELQTLTPACVYGLDIDPDCLFLAIRNSPAAQLAHGDAHTLPYPDATFDLAVCHFLLLWVANPACAIREMARVTRPGGVVAALAEPDYGGRIDYPADLAPLGAWQQEALRQQGADPLMGRKLPGLLHAAGLGDVETGILGGQWSRPPEAEIQNNEWTMLHHDLAELVAPKDLQAFESQDRTAWARGERVLFVPTFFAWGRVVKLSKV